MSIFDDIVNDVKNVFKPSNNQSSDNSNQHNNTHGSDGKGASAGGNGSSNASAEVHSGPPTPASNPTTVTDAAHTGTTLPASDHLPAGENLEGEEESAWAANAGQIWTDQQNLNFWQLPKDGGTAGGLLPGYQVTNLDASTAATDQAVFDQYWSTPADANAADAAYFNKLRTLEGNSSANPDTQFQPTGESSDGTKTFKNKDGGTLTEGPKGVDHNDKTADTWIKKDTIDVHDKKSGTDIHVDKKDHTVDYKGPGTDGQTFHLKDNGDGTYSDGKGDTLVIDEKHHRLEVKTKDGTEMRITGHEIKVHEGAETPGHKGFWNVFQRTDTGEPSATPATPGKGQTASGNDSVKVTSNDGQATAEIWKNGQRVIDIYDASHNVVQQVFTRADTHQIVIKQPGKNDIELTQENGQWVAQEVGADGQKHDISLNQVKINGHTVSAHDGELQVTGDMKVTSNGQVTSTADTGATLSSQGTGATVSTGDSHNGSSVTATGNGAMTQSTCGGERSQTTYGPDGLKHESQHRGADGHWSHEETTFTMNDKGTIHMGPPGSQGIDIQTQTGGPNGDWIDFKSAHMWNGDTVYDNGTIDRSNGDVINPDGSVSFEDGTTVDSEGDVSQDGRLLGKAGDGDWGGADGDGDDYVVAEGGQIGAAESAISSASGIASEIQSQVGNGTVSADTIGKLLSLYGQLGSIKASLLSHGANLENAALAGGVDSAQADVGGAIGAAQIASFQENTAKSLSAAGASPEILHALEDASAGKDVNSIVQVLKDHGVLDNPRQQRSETDQSTAVV